MIIKNKSIIYTECAEMLRRIRKNKTTLKTEVYKTESPHKYMAILSQVIKNSDKYSAIANDMGMTESNKDLCLIHVHEILNGNIRVKKDLKAKFDALKKKYECNENKEKVTYFRIINKDSEIDIEYQNTALEGVYKTIASLVKSQAYLNGDIIIQNYSSCLPAIVLNPENNSKIIDACAAPGNKSIHLSNLMKNTGKIFAYERDAERYETLRQMLSKYKCKNTKPVNKDFIETKSIKSIDYILVDPSCSGSGIHDLYSKSDSRVSKLAAFQKKILLHALSFENVKKVVYSTCSVHEEENEEVVKYALENNNKFCVEMIKLPGITNNGNQNYEFGDKVIRIDRDKNNNINGFFVALFVRK